MQRKLMFCDRALGITILALILTSLACNAFAGNPEPPPPPPTTAVEDGLNGTTTGPAATVTVPALTPLLTSKVTVLVDLNIRSGPGVKYDRVGFLLKDEWVPVIGINEDSGWWKIECPEIVSETECWVSGGEQYTRAEIIEDVAKVEAPATPTPVPPDLEEGFGILAFIDNGAIYSSKLDLAQTPPQAASEPIQLADMVNVQDLSISPDGRRIAFISGYPQSNSLNVVNTDGQDLRTLVVSSELPLDADENDTDLAVLVDQIAWLPDSMTLAFNTIISDPIGPGIQSQEDLYLVTLDGELSQPFPPGIGGGSFVLTTNGQVLLSRSDNIARSDLEGSNIETIHQFEPINTASEYVFYPIPQRVDGGKMKVFIPDAQPWQPDAWTTLWHIPVRGPAGQLGSINGVTLFDAILWSRDGSRLAYVQQSAEQDNVVMSKLVIADEKGLNASPYAGGDKLTLHTWGSDNATFLYSGNGFFAVGRVNAPPMQTLLSPGQQVSDVQWTTEESFIAAVGYPENSTWDLISSTVSGEQIPLQSLRGFGAQFEVWQP